MRLEVRGIRKSFGSGANREEVLRGINMVIEEGKIAVLLGPSGSGKSTLLNIIGGLESADEGTVTVGGFHMEKMKEKQLSLYRRKYVGYVFQAYNLVPDLTVRENIEVGAYLTEHPLTVDELLVTLGLEEHQHKIPSQLSGGQQQRTAIGRAIVKNPALLLCDEPTGALDYNTSKEILKLIQDVNRTFGNTVIIVTHNYAVAKMADQVIKIRDGQVQSCSFNEEKISADELEW